MRSATEMLYIWVVGRNQGLNGLDGLKLNRSGPFRTVPVFEDRTVHRPFGIVVYRPNSPWMNIIPNLWQMYNFSQQIEPKLRDPMLKTAVSDGPDGLGLQTY